MKEKKRLVVLAVAVVLVAMILLLAGLTKPPQKKVGICFGDVYSVNWHEQIQKTLEKGGYAVRSDSASGDPAQQTQCVRQLIDSEMDLLIVEAVSTQSAQEAAALAKDAKIPLIFIGQDPGQAVLDSWEQICYVGCKPEQAGALQGSVLQGIGNQGDMNGDGMISYLILAGPETDARAKTLTESCRSALAEQELGVVEIGTLWGTWDEAAAITACAQALAQYGKDIEVIFCGSDEIASGAQKAIANGGWTVGEDYYLLGIGGRDGAVQMVLNGTLTATVSEGGQKQGQKILELAQKLQNEEAVEKYSYIEPEVITAGNAK